MVEAARQRLVDAALALRPVQRRSLAPIGFKVKTAKLLLRLAERPASKGLRRPKGTQRESLAGSSDSPST